MTAASVLFQQPNSQWAKLATDEVAGVHTIKTTPASGSTTLAADGTVAAPAYAFASEPGLGMWRAGAAVLGFAALGADTLRLVGVASAVDYIEIVPSITGTPGRVMMRAAGLDASISFVTQPKGAGALAAQMTDSGTAGGNARGANAVDWQMLRTAANQVASGDQSTIGGGRANLANNTYATVAGGNTNTSSGNSATVGGGASNVSSNTNSTIGGGSANAASGTYATVAGGRTNVASGSLSFVGGGGGSSGALSNTASGSNSVVTGGQGNTASGSGSWIPGGFSAATRSIYGRGAWSSGMIAVQGDAQAGEHTLMRAGTSATSVVLTSDNAAANTTNQIILPNNGTYRVKLLISARQTGGAAGTAGDSASWELSALVKRGANAAATAFVGGLYAAPTTFVNTALVGGVGVAAALCDAAASTWLCALAADTTNGGLSVTGTGEASKNIQWTARVLSTENVG